MTPADLARLRELEREELSAKADADKYQNAPAFAALADARLRRRDAVYIALPALLDAAERLEELRAENAALRAKISGATE